jgi:hypothetical protein
MTPGPQLHCSLQDLPNDARHKLGHRSYYLLLDLRAILNYKDSDPSIAHAAAVMSQMEVPSTEDPAPQHVRSTLEQNRLEPGRTSWSDWTRGRSDFLLLRESAGAVFLYLTSSQVCHSLSILSITRITLVIETKAEALVHHHSIWLVLSSNSALSIPSLTKPRE